MTNLDLAGVNAASAVSSKKAEEEHKKRAASHDNDNTKVKKEGESFIGLLFGGLSEKSSLKEAGLPPEIAGKSIEEALVFLKDKVTMAGDVLTDKMTEKAFGDYRVAVKQMLRFVVKNSFAVEKRQAARGRRSRRTVYTQVDIIDKKLNELAAQIFLNQKNKFAILDKTKQIAGLIVDMFF